MMRRLRLSPFACVALVAGLTGSLILLAVLDAAVLHPIPGVREPQRLLSLATPRVVSYPAVHELDEAARAQRDLAGIAGFSQRWFAVDLGAGAEERHAGTVVAGDYFGLLGAGARLGRLLGPIDDRPDAPPVVVLSNAFWRQAFAARPDVVGTSLRLNGSTFEVVGVAASGFRGLARERAPDFWLSARAWFAVAPSSFGKLSLESGGWDWLRAFGRLNAGATPESARQMLQSTVGKRLQQESSNDDYASLELVSTTLAASGLGSSAKARSLSLAIAIGVALLLLLAAASAAQIFFARAAARRQEVATRLALGAGIRRLVLLMLVEPLAIVALSVGLALPLTSWLLSGLAEQALPGGARLGDFGLAIDFRVATAGAALALVTGFVAGLVPAWRLLRNDLTGALGTTRSLGGGGARLRRGFSIVQVAVSLVLLTATALCVRALSRESEVDTGYRGAGLAFVQLDAGLARLAPEVAATRYTAALAAIRQLGGVEAAALLTALPLDPGEDVETFGLAGYVQADGRHPEAEVAAFGGGALSLLGVEVIAGREIEDRDDLRGEPVVVVNEAFVRRFLADREPLGTTLDLGGPRRIVGVIRDVRAHGFGETQGPAIFAPWQQVPSVAAGPIVIAWSVRPGAGPSLADAVAAAGAAAPGVPVEAIGTFQDLVASSLAAPRFGAGIFGLFSLVALVLAATGLFGLVLAGVALRTRELGLRSALGALPSRLVLHVLSDCLRPVLIGLGIGMALSVPLAFAARGLFVGLERFDLAALLLAGLVLALTAALATLLPATRAARLDPSAALRDA